MRPLKLLLPILVAMAAPLAVQAADDSSPSVVVLRGNSAPPTPWYAPPASKEVEVREVQYVPVYYLVPALGFGYRHKAMPLARHRQ